MPVKSPQLVFESATIFRRNFRGIEYEFNKDGDRNFLVEIPDIQQALDYKEFGWRVKGLEPKKTATPQEIAEFVPRPFLQVSVGYKFNPPRIILITSRARTTIVEATVDTLDSVDIANIDIVVRGRWNDMNGGGYKPWLKSMYIIVDEDPMALKYADVPVGDSPIAASTAIDYEDTE